MQFVWPLSVCVCAGCASGCVCLCVCTMVSFSLSAVVVAVFVLLFCSSTTPPHLRLCLCVCCCNLQQRFVVAALNFLLLLILIRNLQSDLDPEIHCPSPQPLEFSSQPSSQAARQLCLLPMLMKNSVSRSVSQLVVWSVSRLITRSNKYNYNNYNYYNKSRSNKQRVYANKWNCKQCGNHKLSTTVAPTLASSPSHCLSLSFSAFKFIFSVSFTYLFCLSNCKLNENNTQFWN